MHAYYKTGAIKTDFQVHMHIIFRYLFICVYFHHVSRKSLINSCKKLGPYGNLKKIQNKWQSEYIYFEEIITVLKMSKYGFFCGPYFPVFSPNAEKYGLEKAPYLNSFHAVNTIITKLLSTLMLQLWWWLCYKLKYEVIFNISTLLFCR